MRGETERLSQKEMRNHKANKCSITVMCFGKSTWFSAFGLSRSAMEELSLNVFEAFSLWWEKTEEKRRTGFILKDNSRSGKHRDYFVHKWAGNWKPNYTNSFNQFCHHNPKSTMHLKHDHNTVTDLQCCFPQGWQAWSLAQHAMVLL